VTSGLPFSTRETVGLETLANRAMSLIVNAAVVLRRFFVSSSDPVMPSRFIHLLPFSNYRNRDVTPV
jgi:hypothetical protein